MHSEELAGYIRESERSKSELLRAANSAASKMQQLHVRVAELEARLEAKNKETKDLKDLRVPRQKNKYHLIQIINSLH